MRDLCGKVVSNIADPASPDTIVASISDTVTELRGRPVHLKSWPFPHGTVSGVWVDREDDDVIAFHARTDLQHQLVIIGHEIWHMLGSGHAHGAPATRARERHQAVIDELTALFTDEGADTPRLSRAVLTYAARTHFDEDEEKQAEFFGLQFATRVRPLLAAPTAHTGIAGRIERSLLGRPTHPGNGS